MSSFNTLKFTTTKWVILSTTKLVREPLDKLDPNYTDFDKWETMMYVLALTFAIEGKYTKQHCRLSSFDLSLLLLFRRPKGQQTMYHRSIMLTRYSDNQTPCLRLMESYWVLERRFLLY